MNGRTDALAAPIAVSQPAHRPPGGTLYRYVIVEMVFPTLFTLGGLMVVVLTRDLLGFSDLVINRGLGVDTVSWIAFYKIVPLSSQMMPFAVLVGALVALGRLGADRELLTLEASGVSSPRLLGPVMCFAAVMAAMGFALSLYAAPWAIRTLDSALIKITETNPGATLTAGKVYYFGTWKIEAREVSPRGDRLRGVLLWMPDVGETVFAESGVLGPAPGGETSVALQNGTVLLNPRKRVRELRFDTMKTVLPRNQFQHIEHEDADEIAGGTLATLRHIASEGEQAVALDARTELHRRFSMPAATLVFGRG